MENIIEALKNNEKPFGLMSEEMQAKVEELVIDDTVIQYYSNGCRWQPFTSGKNSICHSVTYRLRPDYTEPDKDRVFSSTTDKELDDMNNTVGVTAHCSCGHVFTDDVVHGKSQAVVDVRSSKPRTEPEGIYVKIALEAIQEVAGNTLKKLEV